MGKVFTRRTGQRIQIGDSMVVVKSIRRRRVNLYVHAPDDLFVRKLDTEPWPEPGLEPPPPAENAEAPPQRNETPD